MRFPVSRCGPDLDSLAGSPDADHYSIGFWILDFGTKLDQRHVLHLELFIRLPSLSIHFNLTSISLSYSKQ